MRQYGAEFFGTFWLVLGGCGSAVLAAAFPNLGIGLLGVSLAFGLTVLTMAYAIGHISGCHLNPAVSVGLWAGGRFPADKLVPYIVAQVLGAVVAAGVLYLIASGKAGFDLKAGFASNGFGEHSPGKYSFGAAASTERAFGGLRSGSLVPLVGASFTNNTGSAITQLAVAFACGVNGIFAGDAFAGITALIVDAR